MMSWRRAASGFVLVVVVVAAIAAVTLAKLPHLPTWANAFIAATAFATGLILDPFKKLATDLVERPRQQSDALLANTRMHNRHGGLRRVRECGDAMALGVHPSAAAGNDVSNTDRLPDYVRRDAHEELEKIFLSGGMVIIEGASAAGKTRLAFQCMRARAPDRWLVVPAADDSLREIAKAATPLKNAVVWLDDMERYFGDGGLGAAVLDELCPPGSSDVVVLATLRAEARSELNAAGRDVSIGRAFNEVMQRARVIWLDRELTEPETARARDLRADPRIAEALDHATRAGFAEYLSAGPATLDRWESARRGEHPVAGAIISAAVDARRAGYQQISRPVLDELHTFYLDYRIRHQAGLPGFDAALEWAVQPVRGASACLLPVTDTTYEPFDYLLDHVQRVGGLDDIPEQIWPILIAHADISDLLRLGAVARTAGQLEYAEQALRRGALMDNDLAMSDLGDLLREVGRLEEAEEWFRRAAETGYDLAMDDLGDLLSATGRPAEAQEWYRRAAEAGYNLAMVHLGDLLREAGQLAEAEEWFRRAAEAGYELAMVHLGDLLEEAGRDAEAQEWSRRAAEAGYELAMVRLGDLLEEAGQLAEAEEWFRRAVGAGYEVAMVHLGDLLEKAGRDAEAEDEFRRSAATGYSLAMVRLGDLLRKAGRVAEAEEWFRRAAETGYELAMDKLGDLLREAGRLGEAEEWFRRAAEVGYEVAMVDLGELLTEAGRPLAAEEWFRRAAQAGYRLAMVRLGDSLREAGRDAEAEEWLRRGAEGGYGLAMEVLGDLLMETGRPAEAREWYRRASLADD